MKKIFTILALIAFSVASFAEVSITLNPSSVDFGTVNMYGEEATGVEDSINFSVTYSGLQPYCGVVYEDVEMPEQDAAFWLSGTNVDGWIYSGDAYNPAEGANMKLHYYATAPGTYTGKIRFYSYADDYWEVESPSVYLNITLKVVNQAPVIETYELISATSGLAEGDVVVFANASAQKVANAHSSTYLAVTNATFTGNTLKSTDAMEFTVGKANGNWTFTNGGQLLGGEDKSLRMGSGVTEWTVSISSGEAEIKPKESTYPIMFNSDRFKLYNPATTSYPLAQLYKKKTNGTGIENQEIRIESRKIMRNGQLIIIRNGEEYSTDGKRL